MTPALPYLGPWCCENAQRAGVIVCDECAEFNDFWQGQLGISEEEKQRRGQEQSACEK